MGDLGYRRMSSDTHKTHVVIRPKRPGADTPVPRVIHPASWDNNLIGAIGNLARLESSSICHRQAMARIPKETIDHAITADKKTASPQTGRFI